MTSAALHSTAWCHILRTNEVSTENKTNKNTNHHHLSQLKAKKTQKTPLLFSSERTGGLADVRSGGGGVENVLIGGPVKQLGEHILAGHWPISLESVLRKHLSVISTSSLLRNRKKEDAASERNLPLTGTRASLQLNPLFGSTMTRSAFLCWHICSPESLPLRPRSTQITLSICASVSVHSLSGQWLHPQNEKNKVRTHVIKNLNVAHKGTRTDKLTVCAN